jgi:hypothetical protein
VNIEGTAEFGSVPIEVGEEDVPTYPVKNGDGFHGMSGRQERRQSDVEMSDEIIALPVIPLHSIAYIGSSLCR